MGRFVIKRTTAGFMFNLLAGNGEIICTSQSYSSKVACNTGIESIKRNSLSKVEDQTVRRPEVLSNPKYEIFKDKAGEFRFRLKAQNGEIIAASQGYGSKAACKKGISSIGKNAPDAEICSE